VAPSSHRQEFRTAADISAVIRAAVAATQQPTVDEVLRNGPTGLQLWRESVLNEARRILGELQTRLLTEAAAPCNASIASYAGDGSEAPRVPWDADTGAFERAARAAVADCLTPAATEQFVRQQAQAFVVASTTARQELEEQARARQAAARAQTEAFQNARLQLSIAQHQLSVNLDPIRQYFVDERSKPNYSAVIYWGDNHLCNRLTGAVNRIDAMHQTVSAMRSDADIQQVESLAWSLRSYCVDERDKPNYSAVIHWGDANLGNRLTHVIRRIDSWLAAFADVKSKILSLRDR